MNCYVLTEVCPTEMVEMTVGPFLIFGNIHTEVRKVCKSLADAQEWASAAASAWMDNAMMDLQSSMTLSGWVEGKVFEGETAYKKTLTLRHDEDALEIHWIITEMVMQ